MIDLKDMLKAGIHFGHKASRWSPKMRPFIWGTKNKIHLIDIAKTSFLLERAGKYLNELASEGKSFLFVGTKKAAQTPIQNITDSLKMSYVINRWIGGTLTNFDQVKKAITRYLHLKDVVKKPTYHYKKKEISMIQKEIGRLEKNIGGILDLDFPPAAIIVIDAKKEHSSIREATNAHIPVVAMVDTNTDPSGVNFIIPGNDDSPRSIVFVLEYLATCIKAGQDEFKNKKVQKETVESAAKAAQRAAKASLRKPVGKQEVKKIVPPKKLEVKPTITAKAPAAKKVETKEVEKPKPTVETKASVAKPTEAKKEVKKAEPKAVVKKETAKAETKASVAKPTEAKKTIKK